MGFGDFLGDVVGGFGSAVGGAWDWLNKTPGTDQAQADRDFLNPYLKQGSPYLSTKPQGSPYQGNYNALVSMLQQRANGQGPSVAQDAYKMASEDAMAKTMALSNSGNPAAARQAAMNLGNIQQGMANGLASARNQEMTAAAGQLGGAIGAADQSDFNRQQAIAQREKANQDAWLYMLQNKMGLTARQLGGKTNMDTLGGLVQGAGAIATM